MEKILADQLSTVVKNVEDQVDEQLERLQKLDSDDLEKLRQERLQKLKKTSQQKAEWRGLGHGEYSEVAEEKDFFEVAKKSKNVVCHFFRDGTFRCKIVDKHLHILAAKHIETKFCKLNAEKCPFLTTKLGVRVLPAVLILVDAIVVDRIVGFTDLGNRDDFSTEVLEWRLAQKDVISYNGDKLNPPSMDKAKKPTSIFKTIRGTEDDGSDSGEEEELVHNNMNSNNDKSKAAESVGKLQATGFELTDEELAALEELTVDAK